MSDPFDASNLVTPPLNEDEKLFIAEKVKECSARLQLARDEIAKEIWGQDKVIESLLACMVAGGNLLAEGLPGLAKTKLVACTARVMGLDSKRIQFTPDLMPTDILGSEVQAEKEGARGFEFIKGPLFTQFLLADEINRASPKTQSALLEAMQEKRVTVAGVTHNLQRPFFVMATQNPVEQEGTYPLPEAQLDRFMLKINVDYPDEAAERRIITETTSSRVDLRELFARAEKGEDLTVSPDEDRQSKTTAILGKNELILMQTLAAKLPLTRDVVDAAIKITRGARPDDASAPLIVKDNVSWGPSPRALQAFAFAARARALIQGRMAPNVEDILALAEPVLAHRMKLNYTAEANHMKFEQIKEKLILGLK